MSSKFCVWKKQQRQKKNRDKFQHSPYRANPNSNFIQIELQILFKIENVLKKNNNIFFVAVRIK